MLVAGNSEAFEKPIVGLVMMVHFMLCSAEAK